MSSPVTIPRPASPRPPRSLAGPVVLIALGIVFLMGTMGMLRWAALGTLYAQYWPVLIILWGVIKLVEHQRARREGARTSGIGAGGVFLLVFLIGSGLLATEFRRVDWHSLQEQIGIDDNDINGLFGQSFTFADTLTQAFPEGGSLHIISDRGSINVVVGDAKRVKVEVSKKVHADNQADANQYDQQTKTKITSSGKTLTINANTQGAGEHGVSADLIVHAPASAALMISSKHGDITVSGRNSDVEISSQHGDVTLEDIHGNANLNLQRSSLKASNISGDLSVDGRVNDVSATNISGAARLTGEFYESVKMAQIGKAAIFKSGRTDMEFARLAGTLDLDSGDLRATSVQGPVRLSTQNKDVHLEDLVGDLRVDDNNGAIEIMVRKTGNLQIDNKNGDIHLTLPSQASFRVDARASNGEIQSDFGELRVNNGENEATATGAVGNGGALVKLNNQHGTIEIRKGSMQAAEPGPPSRRLPQPPSPPEPTEN